MASWASERLGQQRATCQLWYNARLAQSLGRRDGYDEGFVVMVACAADDGARRAAEALRLELEAPDSLVRHATYEQIVGRFAGDDWFEGWADLPSALSRVKPNSWMRVFDLIPMERAGTMDELASAVA